MRLPENQKINMTFKEYNLGIYRIIFSTGFLNVLFYATVLFGGSGITSLLLNGGYVAFGVASFILTIYGSMFLILRAIDS